MRRHRWMAAASAVVLLAACTSDPAGDGPVTSAPSPSEDGPPAPEPTPDPPPPPPQDADERLVAFRGRLLEGGTFDGGALTGHVAVWFWTPW